MIEINLLPENLRGKKQRAFSLERIIYFAKIGFAVLVVIHILLLIPLLSYKYKVDRLDKEWSHISSQNADVISLKKEINALEGEVGRIDGLTRHKFRWAEKLNKLSLLLPPGVWFDRIRVTKGVLDVTGSVVSIDGGEVEVLNKFLQDLKADAVFYSAFEIIDIVSIARSNLFGVEVVDFSIRGMLKADN